MKLHYLHLYNTLLDELDQSVHSGLPERKQFEQYFWLSRDYNKKLIALLDEYPFLNEMDEIDFFRNVKPRFTCFTEFFALSNESLLCVPDSPRRAIAFWNDEKRRYIRFRVRHSSFVGYYESQKRHWDKEYFIRGASQIVGSLNAMIFDSGPEYHSTGDWLVRSLLAHKMYSRYAEEKAMESISLLRSESHENELAGSVRTIFPRLGKGTGSFMRSVYDCVK